MGQYNSDNAIIDKESILIEVNKFNGKEFKDKVHWNLINLKAIENVPKIRHWANVNKYTPSSWKSVPTSLWLEASLRHLLEVMDKGMDVKDNDDGFYHIDKVLTDIMLAIQVHRKIDCIYEQDIYTKGV